MRLVFLCLILLVACDSTPPIIPPGEDPKVLIEADPRYSILVRSQETSHTISIQLEDPDKTVAEAVVFLNVLRYLSGNSGAYESGFGNFEGLTISNNIFGVPLSGDALRQGLNSTIEYRVKENATVGTYNINIQVLRGSETNPTKVNIDNRIGIFNATFDVR
jgi:hypothetical protein